MKFKLLKHTTVGGQYLFSGTLIDLSCFDKILEDGRLVYHYSDDRYQVIPADMYKIVYDSHKEMVDAKDSAVNRR